MVEQNCHSGNAIDTQLSKSPDEVNFCPFPMPPQYDLMPSSPVNARVGDRGLVAKLEDQTDQKNCANQGEGNGQN